MSYVCLDGHEARVSVTQLPIQAFCYRYGHLDDIWNLLRDICPQFKLPELPTEKPAGEIDAKPESAAPDSAVGDDANADQLAKDGKVGKEQTLQPSDDHMTARFQLDMELLGHWSRSLVYAVLQAAYQAY